MTASSVHDVVLSVVLEVGRQRNAELSAAEPTQSLADLGFDSLDLAQVAAELEIRLGVDPFARAAASQIRTVADLLTLYGAAAPHDGSAR